MERTVTNMEIKKRNRNRIFRYIRRHDRISNPELVTALKLSLPTVTQITKELLHEGLVIEQGEFHSTGGRRAKALSLDGNYKLAIGLDITKNHISMVLTNIKGDILHYTRQRLTYANAPGYYQQVHDMIDTFITEGKGERNRILGLGISFPGIVDINQEQISYSHALCVSALPFTAVQPYFDYPCYFINDANAGAYAEGMESDEPQRFFYLSLSNTVGGAIFNHRSLIQGDYFRCGEVGHMTVIPNGLLCYCGKKGCLDAYCAAWQLSKETDGNLGLFFEELKKGNQKISSIWHTYATYLAIAINNIHMVLDCNIILGGYVGSYIAPYIEEIRNNVAQRNTFDMEREFIKPCCRNMEAAAYGASMAVLEDFMKDI
jgi:predicted NBD/HSP70 family sugar kinase